MTFYLGEIVYNVTYRFFAPILNTFNQTFLQNYRQVVPHVMAYAIGDVLFDKAKGKKHKYLLFVAFNIHGKFIPNKKIYVNAKEGRRTFKAFLDYIKKSKYYYDDYIIDSVIHAVVIKIPDEFKTTYDNFVVGKYSKMYKDNLLKVLFSNKDNLAVLKKERHYQEVFKEKIKSKFGVTDKYLPDIDDDTELELPPNKKEDWL
jgi:hypothetical protein